MPKTTFIRQIAPTMMLKPAKAICAARNSQAEAQAKIEKLRAGVLSVYAHPEGSCTLTPMTW